MELTVKFTNNACRSGGGGLYMGLKSTFSILPNTSVYWENNHASLGGAIYVQDASPISYCTLVAQYVPKEECFFTTVTVTQLQTFPLIHFKYAHVKTIFLTVVSGSLGIITFHIQSTLVKHFMSLLLQLDKEMERFLAQW